jgi:hypothetical protein
LGAAPAHAGEAEAAEHARLGEELGRMVSRNAWGGAEDIYQSLVVLEAGGETLSYHEVYLGAQVAQANGDMLACRLRLERALALTPSLEVAQSLLAIKTDYGPVSLHAVDSGGAVLTPDAPPFEPDRRAAISAAQALVARAGRFDGLLPRGSYTFGETHFTVDPQLPVLDVDLARPAARTAATGAAPAVLAAPETPGHGPTLRPRLALGVAYTAGQAPTLDDAAQPPAFGGVGARVAAGAELGLSPALRLWVEGGYHGLTSSEGDMLHLGFVAAGPALSFGRARVAVGGGLGAGALAATGVNDLEGLDAACPTGTDDPDCAWIAAVPEADRANYRWTGTVVTPGANAEVSVRVVPVGGAWLGVGLGGGVFFDPSRAWPFAQASVELLPG